MIIGYRISNQMEVKISYFIRNRIKYWMCFNWSHHYILPIGKPTSYHMADDEEQEVDGKVEKVENSYVWVGETRIHNNYSLPFAVGDHVVGTLSGDKFASLPTVIPSRLNQKRIESTLEVINGWTAHNAVSLRVYTEVLRQLMLRGYMKREVLMMRPHSYSMLTCLPYNLPCIPIERADEIHGEGSIDPISVSERGLALVYRWIYNKMKKKKWVSFPMRLVRELIDDISDITETCETYFCHISMDCLYFHKEHYIECMVADYLLNRTVVVVDTEGDDDEEIASPEGKDPLSEGQVKCIRRALKFPVSIVTGEPGSGKSTMIGGLVPILREKGVRYVILTTTGRATSRLRELMPGEESIFTIHMLITLLIGGSAPPFTYIILDEASTISTSLFCGLLYRIKVPTQILFVGDPNQLEPIQPGRLFIEMIDSEMFPHTHLSELFRYEEEGISVYLRSLIRHRRLRAGAGLIVRYPPVSQRYDLIESMLRTYYEQDEGRCVILTPFTREVKRLHEIAKEVYNPGCEYVDFWGREWSCGDRAMMKANDYQLKVMNGESGDVCEIKEDKIMVRFDNGVTAPFFFEKRKCRKKGKEQTEAEASDDEGDSAVFLDHISCIDPAFAYTIHKSQGNEWRRVMVVITRAIEDFTTINLLYTALSRCQAECVLITERECISRVINMNLAPGYDNLSERLKLGGKESPDT